MTLAPLILFVAALLACAYALMEIGRAVLAARWPTVEGEIAATRIVHRAEADEFSNDYDYVAYRYSVQGQPYRNDRVAFGPQVLPSSIVPRFDPPPAGSAASALERHYPSGHPVLVRYNPRRPEDSVLRAMPSAVVWVILGAGGLFAYLGARELFGLR